MKKLKLALLVGAMLGSTTAFAANVLPSGSSITSNNYIYTKSEWNSIVKQAQGKTVYLYAWGGDPLVNSYLSWAKKQIAQQYDINLVEVKIGATSAVVQQLLADKIAGVKKGAVDIVWINGANFASLLKNKMLYGPFAYKLPNWRYVDKKLPVTTDFGTNTLGYEAPWGVAQLVYIYNSAVIKNPPKNFRQLLKFAEQHPGKVTYPAPPNFYGTAFIKSALIALTHNEKALYQPYSANSKKFNQITGPLWDYLNQLNAVAWDQGKHFPLSSQQMINMLNNNQIDLAITYNPSAYLVQINDGNLPPTAKTYAFNAGALTNVNFLAIPQNAPNKDASLVVINYLMGREAQYMKAIPTILGSPTVLTLSSFTKQQIKDSQLYLKLYKSIPEPSYTWDAPLNTAWQKHYS